MPSRVRAPRRHRSRIVCQRCHARKVKCDLFTQIAHGRKCTNCEKRLESCSRRQHIGPARQSRASQPSFQSLPAADVLQELSPETSPNVPAQSLLSTPSATSDDVGYVGETSVMSNQRLQDPGNAHKVGSLLHAHETQAVLSTEADKLPPQNIIDAMTEIYFQYIYHRMPVVNHGDIYPCCQFKLLQQCLCLAGSVLRHTRASARSEEIQQEGFYAKAKILFFTNQENDPMFVLKSLCLLTLWNVTPPAVITLDCSWSWLGLALRLALQMGLHKESTYPDRTDPGSARRVAWFLYAQDKLHSTCFGRPQMIRDDDFDLPPPAACDFEPAESGRARIFTLYTEIIKLLGNISLLRNKASGQVSEDILSILTSIREWASHIEPELSIFNDKETLIYRRDIVDVLIWYFTCLINLFHIQGSLFRPSAASTISLVASSCAIRLYQEMDYRDDVNYLAAINNWSMMVVALPQLSSIARKTEFAFSAEEGQRSGRSALQELDALLEIIGHRTSKFPGAQALVLRLNDLRKQSLEEVSNESETCAVYNVNHLPVHQISDFFPFPETFAPRMSLLRAFEPNEYLDEFSNFTEWSFEGLMDLQGVDSYL